MNYRHQYGLRLWQRPRHGETGKVPQSKFYSLVCNISPCSFAEARLSPELPETLCLRSRISPSGAAEEAPSGTAAQTTAPTCAVLSVWFPYGISVRRIRRHNTHWSSALLSLLPVAAPTTGRSVKSSLSGTSIRAVSAEMVSLVAVWARRLCICVINCVNMGTYYIYV